MLSDLKFLKKAKKLRGNYEEIGERIEGLLESEIVKKSGVFPMLGINKQLI